MEHLCELALEFWENFASNESCVVYDIPNQCPGFGQEREESDHPSRDCTHSVHLLLHHPILIHTKNSQDI